jgi:hypothetical protein
LANESASRVRAWQVGVCIGNGLRIGDEPWIGFADTSGIPVYVQVHRFGRRKQTIVGGGMHAIKNMQPFCICK